MIGQNSIRSAFAGKKFLSHAEKLEGALKHRVKREILTEGIREVFKEFLSGL